MHGLPLNGGVLHSQNCDMLTTGLLLQPNAIARVVNVAFVDALHRQCAVSLPLAWCVAC